MVACVTIGRSESVQFPLQTVVYLLPYLGMMLQLIISWEFLNHGVHAYSITFECRLVPGTLTWLKYINQSTQLPFNGCGCRSV